MRKWRVGTFSMGLLLIAAGLILLLTETQQGAAAVRIIYWWPVVLVILGVEVLWHVYTSKEEQPTVKYDVFSIFIIFVIIAVSMGAYGLTLTGILPKVNKMIASENFVMKTPEQQFQINNEIKRIVVDGSDCDLIIRMSDGSRVLAEGKAHVRAESAAEAKKYLNGKAVTSRVSGDTIYLSFDVSQNNGDFADSWIADYTLYIPAALKIEIDGGDSVKIYGDQVASDWLIDGAAETDIRLPLTANVSIDAAAEESDGLDGNVSWILDSLLPSASDGADEEMPEKVHGKVGLGSGQFKIKVINGGNVTVNTI